MLLWTRINEITLNYHLILIQPESLLTSKTLVQKWRSKKKLFRLVVEKKVNKIFLNFFETFYCIKTKGREKNTQRKFFQPRAETFFFGYLCCGEFFMKVINVVCNAMKKHEEEIKVEFFLL